MKKIDFKSFLIGILFSIILISILGFRYGDASVNDIYDISENIVNKLSDIKQDLIGDIYGFNSESYAQKAVTPQLNHIEEILADIESQLSDIESQLSNIEDDINYQLGNIESQLSNIEWEIQNQ